jgi:hypothetical protein
MQAAAMHDTRPAAFHFHTTPEEKRLDRGFPGAMRRRRRRRAAAAFWGRATERARSSSCSSGENANAPADL